MIEEYLLEIKSMLRPASISQQYTSEHETLMSVKDVVKLVKVDSTVVYAACKRNELPYIRLGKLYKLGKRKFYNGWLRRNIGLII